jgi:hypothetical protein
VDVSARADPREALPEEGGSGDRSMRHNRGAPLKDDQSVRVAQGPMARKRRVTHDPLRLSHGGLRGDGGLGDALVQVRAVEIEYLEDHEDPNGRQGADYDHPPHRGF